MSQIGPRNAPNGPIRPQQQLRGPISDKTRSKHRSALGCGRSNYHRAFLHTQDPNRKSWVTVHILTNISHAHNDLHLLYVGIAPSSAAGLKARRPRNLRRRLRNHCRGPIGSSTLRRSLTALLIDQLKLDVRRTGRDRAWMNKAEEVRLTTWMAAHARVSWHVHLLAQRLNV